MVIAEYFRALLFDWRKNRAIRQARRSADLHRKKFLVLVWQGRPVCVSMQGVKKLIRPRPLCSCKEPSPHNTSGSCHS